MVGRVSYLGRVKQGNYHTHVLYTIPNPNYTLPIPYPFIITCPIHHPTLGTQTGRVLPYPTLETYLSLSFYSDTLSEYLPYPANHRKNTPPYIEYLPHLPHPCHLSVHTCTHLTRPSNTLYYGQSLIKYKAKTIYQIRPKLPRAETTQAETTQTDTTQAETTQGRKGWNERPENAVAAVEQERTCRVVSLIIWLSIVFGCKYSGLLIYLL